MIINNSTLNQSSGNISIISSNKFTIESMIDRQLLNVEVLTMTFVLVMCLVGNSIVVLTLLMRSFIKKSGKNKNKPRKLTRMNFFILHLCLADIYVGLGNVLTMLLWRRNDNIFYGGNVLCHLVAYFQVVSVYYSTYVLITMTIDRFEAICRPLIGLSWSKQRGLYYVGVAFVAAHLQGIPQVFFSH